MKSRYSMSIVAMLTLLLSVGGLFVSGASTVRAQEDFEPNHEFADPAFEDRWARTDMPVAENEVDRTWIWGPGPFTDGMMEPYEDSPGGQRLVQYFDKSRMEINVPNATDDGLWYVTNGLLVVEMVEGRYQVGDDEYDDTPDPAEVNIVGDPAGDMGHGPTYADINAYGLMDMPATTVGTTITATIDANGNVTNDAAFADYNVTAAQQVTVVDIDHTVASVFWEFMTSEGTVWENGQYIVEDLFLNPYYATGYPITEAYWTSAMVGGTERDVLWQCFERRCLTYTPGNPEGFLVEAGNVGQHYYRWRHETDGEPTNMVDLFLISTGTGDVGCGDSLVAIQQEIESGDSTEERITAALQALFGLVPEDYEDDGLYNALQNSDLSVSDVTIENGTATVMLSGDLNVGGVCDEPRIREQIRQTVLQFEGINTVNIMLNGEPLFEEQTETVDLYLVSIGDDGQSGIPVGCEDSLVAIQHEIQATNSTEARITAALQALLNLSEEDYAETDLYNALQNSNLNVSDVTLDNGTATIMLTGELTIGGVCDEPRVEGQIRLTALQFEGVNEVVIILNGEPLFEPQMMTVDLYLVSIGTGEVGCDDSLVAIQREIQAGDSTANRIGAALDALFGLTEDDLEGTDLYNALANSNLTVEDVTLNDGTATIMLSGELNVAGVCDEPRIEEQIRRTAMQFEDVDNVVILFNGGPLFESMPAPDSGIVAIFDVNGAQFRVWVTNEQAIEDILALQAGESQANIPNGQILHGPGEFDHNAPWSWHLSPEDIEMAEVAAEACDGAPSFVEANTDYFVDQVGRYCP